jgi:hypothetical protein
VRQQEIYFVCFVGVFCCNFIAFDFSSCIPLAQIVNNIVCCICFPFICIPFPCLVVAGWFGAYNVSAYFFFRFSFGVIDCYLLVPPFSTSVQVFSSSFAAPPSCGAGVCRFGSDWRALVSTPFLTFPGSWFASSVLSQVVVPLLWFCLCFYYMVPAYCAHSCYLFFSTLYFI